MPCFLRVSSLLLCAIVLSTCHLLPTLADDNDYDFEGDEEFSLATTTSPDEAFSLNGFVACGHVRRLLHKDSTQFDLGVLLKKCWQRGLTVEDVIRGATDAADRPDMENYEMEDLYLPCEDVFGKNITKLTSSLLEDFFSCRTAGAVDAAVNVFMEKRFADIIEVYMIGNQSMVIDEETLVSCSNSTKQLALLCRQYGLTAEQWSRGFLTYHYRDRFVVEEELTELSLTCDRVFAARLQEEAYDDPVEAFAKCQASMPMEPELRDAFEKKNAEKVMEYRAQTANTPGVDLRAYVSCRHLRPLQLRNAVLIPSRYAVDRCNTVGLSYNDLQAGVDPKSKDRGVNEIEELYVRCESVFNDELGSFTTALLHDYERCKEVGKVKEETRTEIRKKFAKLFALLANTKLTRSINITDKLVSCSGFTGKLADLCRRNGSTLAQELRGIGSISRSVGDLWLNTEDLDSLYLQCTDLFDEYTRLLRAIPLEQYMQCRWADGVSANGRSFVDKRIGRLYRNRHRWNGTRYWGDTDIEITSMVLANRGGDE